MATLADNLMQNDKIIQQFRSMNTEMTKVIVSLKSIQNISSNAFNVSTLESVQLELHQVGASYNQVEQEIHQASQAQEKLEQKIKEADQAQEDFANKFLNNIKSILSSYLNMQTLGEVLALSDEMASTSARLSLLLDEGSSQQELDNLEQMIFDSAKRTYSSYFDIASMVSKLGLHAGDAFSSNEEMIAFTELMKKNFSIGGASIQEQTAAMDQLVQGMAEGKLQANEVMTIMKTAPLLAQAIEEQMKTIDPGGSMKEWAAEGLITAEVIKAALFSTADDVNAKFASMPTTFGNLWTNFKTEALNAFSPVLQQLNDIANSERFQGLVNGVTQTLYIIAPIVQSVLSGLTSLGAFIYDNWSKLEPVIVAATVALIAYGVAQAWINREKIIEAVLTATEIVRKWLFVAATIAQTAATYGLTGAMLALSVAIAANPIGWLIGAIFVFILLVYAAVAAINHFAGTSISATGIIAGAFAVLGAFIYNQIAFWWNLFATIAEFFVNVWQHPMYSVKKLFHDLVVNLLDKMIAISSGWDEVMTSFVNSVIDAVNGAIRAWNWFINLLPDEIVSKVGLKEVSEYKHRESITSDLERIKENLGEWLGEPPSDLWEAPRMDYISYGDTWNKGYNWGKDLFNFGGEKEQDNSWEQKLEEILKQNTFGDGNGFGNGFGNGTGNGLFNDTAGNTMRQAESIDMIEEDISYLRDLAEREAINRYTTAEIIVDMKNENYINSELDIDGIIDRFGERAEEVAEMIAEGGVY